VDNPDRPPLPDLTGKGAAVPYQTYEAEDMTFTGRKIGPSRKTLSSSTDIAAEASGRQGVDLRRTGDYVEWTATKAANAIVVRFAVNDAHGGKGLKVPVTLSVDGVAKRDLTLTSEYAVVYGDFPWKNDPSLGSPRHYFDEVRALVDPIPAGAKVRLTRPAANDAKYCVIDLVDLEQVAPPLAAPAGYLSIADFGAVPDDGKPDNDAIEACVAAAKKQKAPGIYFPPGHWNLSEELYPDTIFQGAGMWYTVLETKDLGFQGSKKTFEIHDLSVNGQVKERNDSVPSAGFQGIAGPRSVIENVWITHTKVGMWTEKGTDGLVVRGCRIRDTMADGINLYRGAKNCVIENNSFRGTGDDAVALWSSTEAANTDPDENNVVRHNTIQCPWLANGIAVYGGKDNRVEGNLVADTGLNGAGIDVSSRFDPVPFSGTLTLKDNALVRCGSAEGDGGVHGALWFDGRGKGIGSVIVDGLEIYDATNSGITVQGPGAAASISLSGVSIDGVSGYGIRLLEDASGTLRIERTTVRAALQGGLKNQSAVTVSQGDGNTGL
jgi:hypothetical protein